MKVKRYLGFIIATAVTAALSVILAAVFSVYGVAAVNIFYMPFLWIGKGLRAMSLAGIAGNVFAIIIYALVCLIPAGVAATYFIRDKKITASKITLLVLSGYCFAMMYFFINQNAVCFFMNDYLTAQAREGYLSVFNFGIALAFYGLLLLAVCFKAVSGVNKKSEKLGAIVKILSAVVGCVCCYALFGGELISFISDCKVGGADAWLGAVALMLHGGLYALLYLAAFVAYGGVGAFSENLFAPKNTAVLKRVSKLCLWAFFGGIISCILLNILNFAFVSFIKYVSFELSVPLTVAIVAAGAALACKLLERAIELHEENALTI